MNHTMHSASLSRRKRSPEKVSAWSDGLPGQAVCLVRRSGAGQAVTLSSVQNPVCAGKREDRKRVPATTFPLASQNPILLGAEGRSTFSSGLLTLSSSQTTPSHSTCAITNSVPTTLLSTCLDIFKKMLSNCQNDSSSCHDAAKKSERERPFFSAMANKNSMYYLEFGAKDQKHNMTMISEFGLSNNT